VQAGFIDNSVHYPYNSAVEYIDGKGFVKISLPDNITILLIYWYKSQNRNSRIKPGTDVE